MIVLRDFQETQKAAIYREWEESQHEVVMSVLPTGAGKTAVMSAIALDNENEQGCIMAHRSELVAQISVAMGRNGLHHGLIASRETIKGICDLHMQEFGQLMYDPTCDWRIGSVDTLRKCDTSDPWFKSCTKVFQDEGHHTLLGNKWGTTYNMFPNKRKRGLLKTATPKRADKKGLGRHAHGIADAMVVGPSMGWMIGRRYLTPYKIVAPPPESIGLDMDGVGFTASGEFNEEARKRIKSAPKIVGSVVDTYIKYAMGLRGVTFAIDVEEAEKIAAEFNRRGVPAEVVTGETPAVQRRAAIQRLDRGELLQLVNVDLFGEGFDLPAIECVSFARPTASYALYVQQFGRALRLKISSIYAAAWDTYSVEQRDAILAESGKSFAWIFDHVGNVVRHNGPPDRPPDWTLDAETKRNTRTSKPEPYTTCSECINPFSRLLPECPFCGTPIPVPEGRSRPEEVDGDLTIYTDEMIAQLWGAIEAIYDAPNLRGLSTHAQRSVLEKSRNNIRAQNELRSVIAEWAGHFNESPDRVNYRRFFHLFDIDVAAAKGLQHKEADALKGKIQDAIAQIVNNL